MKIHLIFSTLLLVVRCHPALCHWPQYTPFSGKQQPKPYTLEECAGASSEEWKDVERTPDGDTLFKAGEAPDSPRLRLPPPRTYNDLYMAVESSDGKSLAGPQLVSDGALTIPGVYHSDLNRDGKPDFVVSMYMDSISRLGGVCRVAFALSDKDEYRITVLTTKWADPNDFLAVGREKRPVFLHSWLVYGEEGRDGKAHNYWVYHLFEFKGAEVVPADHLLTGFPKWIWFTKKPNHKASNQLTPEQKERVWEENEPDGNVFWKPTQDQLDRIAEKFLGPQSYEMFLPTLDITDKTGER